MAPHIPIKHTFSSKSTNSSSGISNNGNLNSLQNSNLININNNINNLKYNLYNFDLGQNNNAILKKSSTFYHSNQARTFNNNERFKLNLSRNINNGPYNFKSNNFGNSYNISYPIQSGRYNNYNNINYNLLGNSRQYGNFFVYYH